MSFRADRMRMGFIDHSSTQAWMMVRIPKDLDPLLRVALSDAIDSCQNGHNVYRTLETDTMEPDVVIPPSEDYNAYDMMTLLFQCADMTTISVTVPCPKPSNFLPDGKTVDPLATEVSILIVQCTGIVVNGVTQSPVTNYVRGWRWAVRPTVAT